MTWREGILGEIIDFYDHKRVPLSSSQRESFRGEYRYYGAQGVIDYVKDFIFDGSYLLVAEDGENLRSRKQPIAFEVSGKFWVNNHAHIIKAKSGISNDKFIQSLLNTISIEAYITGAAQPKLSQANMKAIKVKIPALPTQQKIAHILSAYDDLIENNLKRIKLLEEMAQQTYEEWFVRMKFPNHKTTPIDAETGLPEGWSSLSLNQSIHVNPTTKPEKGIKAPFVPMGSLSTNSMTIINIEERIPSGGAKFINGDTLVARITPCLENGKTGYVDFLDENVVATGSTEFIVLRETESANKYFIYCVSRSEYFRELSIRSMSGSDGRQRVNPKIYGKMLLTTPTKEIMDKFENKTRPLFEAVHSMVKQNQHLKEARDILLPRLMTGIIDVDKIKIPSLP